MQNYNYNYKLQRPHDGEITKIFNLEMFATSLIESVTFNLHLTRSFTDI